jgi:hypothetical protein
MAFFKDRMGDLARLARAVVACSFGLAIACAAPKSSAGFGAPRFEPPDGPYRPPPLSPAESYARLDRESCEAELTHRGIAFVRVDSARGVLEPVRLGGALHGVTYHSELPVSQRRTSPIEIVDCRLVLALDDFAAQLASHDVVEVVHYSMYRPPSIHWPAEKTATRHPGGLAIDAAKFVRRDGTKLVVERDFHGRIGARTCGPGTGPQPATADALELRKIVCDAAAAKLFNVALTPDFNWPHRNHFHLEVTANTKWFYLH